MLLEFCQWLETTPGSVALLESLYMYPIVESIHVWALALFLGLAMVMDLRLLGLTFRGLRVSEVLERLLPWVIGGFVIMVVSGALLFYASPVRTYQNVFFRIKVVLLIIAGLNVWRFHAGPYKKVAEWDLAPRMPPQAKIAGALSLFLWACIVTAGRLIAYNWFEAR